MMLFTSIRSLENAPGASFAAVTLILSACYLAQGKLKQRPVVSTSSDTLGSMRHLLTRTNTKLLGGVKAVGSRTKAPGRSTKSLGAASQRSAAGRPVAPTSWVGGCLRKLLAGIPVKINLLPLNGHDRTPHHPPTPERVEAFQQILLDANLNALVRTPRGRDIAAACGQLGESVTPPPSSD